jgi:hypothetical protein
MITDEPGTAAPGTSATDAALWVGMRQQQKQAILSPRDVIDPPRCPDCGIPMLCGGIKTEDNGIGMLTQHVQWVCQQLWPFDADVSHKPRTAETTR